MIGGTLFIGRALVRLLLARGDQVTILHRGKATPFTGRVDEIHCDRNDVDAVGRALDGARFDVVYDNAYDWQRGTTAEQVNAAALACAGELRRYVFMSSVAAYGEGERLSEEAPLAPADHPEPYVHNKAETERMLFRLCREQGFPAVTLRPPYVYGPENPFYRESFFWDRLLADRPIIIPGDGSRLMQFALADDLARAGVLAADTDAATGCPYNIANDEPITQVELVESLARAAGKKADLVHVPRERIHALGGKVLEPPYYFAQYFDMPAITLNTNRARAELGFQPMPFEKGLELTFRWYQEQSTRPDPDFSFDDKLLRSR